jgi:hypothetical protein
MAKYSVTIEETVRYQFEVEAESETEAKLAAEDAYGNADNLNDHYLHSENRKAIDVELLE